MLDYKFKIIEVLPEQNQMMVKFISEGRNDVVVGVPLPTEGVPIEDFLRPYAPIGYWLEQERKVFIPQVGTTGQYIHADELAKAEAAAETPIPTVESQLTPDQLESLITSLK